MIRKSERVFKIARFKVNNFELLAVIECTGSDLADSVRDIDFLNRRPFKH